VRTSPARRAFLWKSKTVRDNSNACFIKLHNRNNMVYTGDFVVGGQILNAVFDTGSFEIIALSTACKSCSSEVLYDAKSSPTFVKDPKGVFTEQAFGSGTLTSARGLDTVQLHKCMKRHATSMPFWQVVEHKMSILGTSWFDAIVGLGAKDQYPVEAFDRFKFPMKHADDDTLVKRLDLAQFSMCLERGSEFAPGWISVRKDPHFVRASSGFATIPLVGKTFWSVKLTNVGPTDKDPCKDGCFGLIDSGTSLIGIYKDHLENLRPILDKIEKDCSNINDLPDLTFDLGGHPFRLPFSAYIMKNDGVCEHSFDPVEDRSSHHGPFWILGMPFLRHYYTVFDRKHRKLHIAPATEDCKPILGDKFARFDARSSPKIFKHKRGAIFSKLGPAMLPSFVRPSGRARRQNHMQW